MKSISATAEMLYPIPCAIDGACCCAWLSAWPASLCARSASLGGTIRLASGAASAPATAAVFTTPSDCVNTPQETSERNPNAATVASPHVTMPCDLPVLGLPARWLATQAPMYSETNDPMKYQITVQALIPPPGCMRNPTNIPKHRNRPLPPEQQKGRRKPPPRISASAQSSRGRPRRAGYNSGPDPPYEINPPASHRWARGLPQAPRRRSRRLYASGPARETSVIIVTDEKLSGPDRPHRARYRRLFRHRRRHRGRAGGSWRTCGPRLLP